MHIIRVLLLIMMMVAGAFSSASASDIEGIWIDPQGGIFTLKARHDRIAWIGQGAKEKKYFLHKGVGTADGNTLQGEWVDLPESEFYPSAGKITGIVSGDGQSIQWRDSKGYYKEWVRQITLPSDKAAENIDNPLNPDSWGEVAATLQTGQPSDTTAAAPRNWGEVGETMQQGQQAGDTSSPQSLAEVEQRQSPSPSPDKQSSMATILADAGNPLGGVSDQDLQAILDDPLAWQQPQIQQLIDEWLRTALPEHAQKDPTARYEEWGRITGRGITMAGKPDIDEPRYHYLWRNAAKFPSLNLCTMRVFVERSIRGESTSDCRGDNTADSSTPDWRFAPESDPTQPEPQPPASNALQDWGDLNDVLGETAAVIPEEAPASSPLACAGSPGQVRALANGHYLTAPPALYGLPVVAVFLGNSLNDMESSTNDEDWQPYFGQVEFVFFFPADLADMEVEPNMPVAVGIDNNEAVHSALFGNNGSYPHLAVFDRKGRLVDQIQNFNPATDSERVKQMINNAIAHTCGQEDYDHGIIDGKR